jgi:excisionase family DNA binding protein
MSIETMLNDSTQLLTFEQVRAILNVSKSTLRRWIASGKLSCIRLGRLLRFDPSNVAEVLRARSN